MSTFRLPDLGEGLLEAEIVTWHVSVGDHVVADQPLVSVETEKALVELPSPVSGHVTALFGEPGDILKVGDPLADFDGGEAVDAGTVVGEIAREPEKKPAPSARPPAPAPGVQAAPAVRALAHQLGVDLSAIQPTGPGGSVTSADVQRAARPGRRKLAEEAWEPLRGVRRTMARNMALARSHVAPATLYEDADVQSWSDDTDPTLRLIRAMARGCADAPALNAWYQAEAGVRHCHAKVDLGIAMNTDDGLFVPVLRDAGNRDDDELRAELQRVKTAVEARRLPPDELADQTITLSNFGTIGGRYGALVVVPPQVAILGAGRIRQALVPVDGEPAVHKLLPLSLTFDHRVVTGAEAARFLGAVIDDLER